MKKIASVKKLPEGFVDKVRLLIPSHKVDAFLKTFTTRRQTTFRCNTLKTNKDILEESLRHQGFQLQEAPGIPNSFILKNESLRELQKTTEYTEGQIYVQNLSSMIPPFVLEPQPGDTILDMAAAPGSKTTQIAAMMQGEGELFANDNNKIRFFKLKANVEMQGVENATLSLKYGESFGRSHPEYFDRILLDAPCSSEGRFLVQEPKTFGYWKPRKVKEMAKKQKRLLVSALSALKVGGTLVYSTCTFSPEENEEVLDWALRKFPGCFELEPIELKIQNSERGRKKWLKKEYDSQVTKSLRILPSDSMEGFFVAKIRKLTSLPARE